MHGRVTLRFNGCGHDAASNRKGQLQQALMRRWDVFLQLGFEGADRANAPASESSTRRRVTSNQRNDSAL